MAEMWDLIDDNNKRRNSMVDVWNWFMHRYYNSCFKHFDLLGDRNKCAFKPRHIRDFSLSRKVYF